MEKIADSRFSERWILRVDVKISWTKIFSVSPSKSVYRGEIGEISIRQHNKLGWNEVKETKVRVLNTFAETYHVNFSQVLQDALTAMYQRQMAKWYEQGEYAKKKELLFFRGFFSCPRVLYVMIFVKEHKEHYDEYWGWVHKQNGVRWCLDRMSIISLRTLYDMDMSLSGRCS